MSKLHSLCRLLTRHRWRRMIVSHGGRCWYVCRVCGSVVREEAL